MVQSDTELPASGLRSPTSAVAAPKRVRIHLQDQGQDFLWWDLEERDDDYSYRVVDCGPFQAWMWTEYFVAKSSVRKGRQPLITKDEKSCTPLKYPITRVEKLKSRSAS